MPEIKIDVDVCKKDGFCAMACGGAIFQQKEKGTVPEITRMEACFSCGHCVAICPHEAISHSDFPQGTVTPIKPEHVPTYDQVLELIRSRRSQRVFKEKKVEREIIEKVLEAARFAPSGHNSQSTEFVVVQDKKTIHDISALTAGYLKNLVHQVQNPISRTIFRLMAGRRQAEAVIEIAPELEGLVSLFNDGTDYILREAPVLVLFSADSAGGTIASVNANLALHNAALAAEAVGLGCFYVGFVLLACDRDNSIARRLSLPETHKIYGTLAMGYPRVTFKKWPERNPAKITWVGAG
ncbi:MAG: nitroreductase [Proteobacteria bacterium]|nr:nitroreductase [Pseudomonadota bacterium]